MSRTNPHEWLWPYFYPKEKYQQQDSRLELVNMLYDFFLTPPATTSITNNIQFGCNGIVLINIHKLSKIIPFPDFKQILTTRPMEVTNAIGMALSRIANEKCPYLEIPIIKEPRFYHLHSYTSFGDIKSNVVGQLIAIRGHVIRVSSLKPLLLKGKFRCPKCRNDTIEWFEDGIFNPPEVCSTPK